MKMNKINISLTLAKSKHMKSSNLKSQIYQINNH